MKKAIDEMRAWLEKKIIAIEEWLPKIEKWTEDFMTAKRDIEMMQAILAELELKMTEWTPDRPCPKEGAALAGPSEEARADMAEYVRELYVGSHNPVENVPNKKGHYPCKFRWCSGKYDKLIKFILGHAEGGEREEG